MLYFFGLKFGKEPQPVVADPDPTPVVEDSEAEKSLRESVEERKEAFRGVRAEENRVIAAAYDKAAARMRDKRLADVVGEERAPAASC